MEVENGKSSVATFPIEKYEKSRYKKEFRSQNDLVQHVANTVEVDDLIFQLTRGKHSIYTPSI
jgi:hypothetical protein